MESVITEERFQHGGQQSTRAVEHSEAAENNEAREGKVAVLKGSKVYDWVGLTRFPENQPATAQDEQSHEGLHSSKSVAEPVPLLSFAQQYFPANESDDQQPQADRIEAHRIFAQRFPRVAKIVGILDGGPAKKEGQGTHRQIDVENPAPGKLVGDIAAQGRPQHRSDQGCDAKKGLSRALFL